MYLLVLVQIFQSSLLVVRSCPALCACTSGNSGLAELRLVQCSDPGISVVPINVPADTVKLRLEKTLLSRVPRAAFYNLSELRFLWLTYNSIISIHPSSFVNLKALRELRLDGNLLTSFPWEGLRDMPRLQTLSLNNNRLSSLPAHASLFLPNITYLDLSSNRLTILPAELLDLWFPLPGQQGGPVQRRILGLHDNPWLCDCQISMVMSLSMSLGSPVVLMDQLLICSRSLGQSGILLTQVELSRCMRPSVQPAATRVISPLGSNVILRCDATGYPTPTLTWIKTSTYADCCKKDILENSDQLPRNLESCKWYYVFSKHKSDTPVTAEVKYFISCLWDLIILLSLMALTTNWMEHAESLNCVPFYVSVMQESPRVGVRWSIISLNGLSYKDAGEYRCQARNMAGIAEAPIKLKVVGVTRLSRLPKKKSQKTSPKSSSKYRKSNQTMTTANTPSVKENQISITPPYISKTQTTPDLVFKMFPVDKRSKLNLPDAKRKTQASIKSTREPPEKSLLSETLV
uniref:leucine-rich repeat, immunoglobulin-like domain and transmembrane domain-containing protein 3b n=1 Tax=Scatophagus argus TaxID=75038 RepID=UPI001ED82FE8|nr:leucine-rich repeat, immunoglobulin-like domain and transmembrane domain-containing protein 3b [Scatophagus argus]